MDLGKRTTFFTTSSAVICVRPVGSDSLTVMSLAVALWVRDTGVLLGDAVGAGLRCGTWLDALW